MNRLIYSILLAILFTLNLSAVLMAAPTYAPAQAPGVTADIEVLSPLNITDPLLIGKNISIYLSDCCLLAVIDVQSLEDQGVDVGLVDILFTPDANWWGAEVLKYIDLNATTSTDNWTVNPETGVRYAIIRSSTNPNIVLLAIDLSSIDLSNAVVNRDYFGDVVSMNLYGIPLWLRVRDYNPPSPPDSALSVNRFAVIQPPVINWDEYITVTYFRDSTEVDKAKYGTFVNITIRLPDEIKYMLNIVSGAPQLTFDDLSVFNVTMFNLDDSTNKDRDQIFSNLWTSFQDNNYLESVMWSYSADRTVLYITGYITEFAPLAVHEDASFEPKAFYGFEVYLELNYTADVDYGLNLSELPSYPKKCPNVVDNDTISFYYNTTGSTSTVYVEVWSSLTIVYEYTNVMHDPTDLNPGDVVQFELHNIPVPYNDTTKLYQVIFTTSYTTITSTLFTYVGGVPEFGVLVYNVTLPDGEWGGLTAYVTFVFKKVGYEIRVSEHPDCYLVNITVKPYADIFVLLNDPSYIVYQDGVIYREFVHWSQSDYTAAPGDYLLVKGYGFITEGGLNVLINDTIVLRKVLEINSSVDPGLAPGRAILVVKIQRAGFYGVNVTGLYDAVLVMDTSGSMTSIAYDAVTRIELAINSTKAFIDSVSEDGTWAIGLVAFNSSAYVLTPSMVVVDDPTDKTSLKDTLDREIGTGGLTQMDDAIYAAVNLADTTGRAGAAKVIILITDGLPTSESDTIAAANYARSRGYFIVGVFVGDPSGTGDEFLESISDYFINVTEVGVENLPDIYADLPDLLPTLIMYGVICPCENNTLTIVGTLYNDTNRYTPDENLTIGFRPDLWKLLVNPGLLYDPVEQTVYVTQERLPFFDVYYDLVDDPAAPGGDKFVEDTWDNDFRLEVIGVNAPSVDLVFDNTYPHFLNFTWDTISLQCGYAYVNYTGSTIPFLPMGTYTIVVLNGTDVLVPEAINGSNVFEVHPNLDIDVLPDDDTSGRRCCNVTFNVVGGLPNTNLTFYGSAVIKITTDMFGGPTTWRTESVNVTIETDGLGTGSVTVPGIEFYSSTELWSDVKSYMDGHSFTGSGDISFTIDYEAVLDYFKNETFSPVWYVYWGTNTEREFTLEITGTVHYFEVVDEINWTASIKVPRTRVVVTVPETILPGDNITIQIIVHKSDVPHDQVTPEEIWELMYPYWISVRLVDLSASTGGTWQALYGGWLRFDSGTTEIVLPNGKVAKLVRVLEDVDGDGVDEIVFLVVIPAPVVMYDMTLRVDVNITLAFENTGTPTFLDLEDYNCTFEANYTGARMWATEYTYVLYGGDDQLTTVLGLLEAKLDYINGTTVYIKGKVNDIWTFITVDLMDFLQAMNNSIITKIDGSTATILTKLGEVNVSLTNLMLTLASEIEFKIDESTATIIAKLEDVNETLYLKIDESTTDLETLLNSIYSDLLFKLDSINTTITYYGDTLEMKIDTMNDTLTTLITTTRDEIISAIIDLVYAKLETMETNIIGNITFYGDLLEMKIDAVNETLYLKIEESTDFLASLISDLFSRLDELEANVIYTIYAVNSSIIRHIDVVADDLRYDILLRIDEAESTLSDLITVKADEIKYLINESTTTIIAKIGESTLTITDAIDSAKADLEVYIDGQTATIRSDIAAVKTDTESIIDLVNTLQTSVDDLSAKLVQVNDTLYALVLSVGDDVKATIVGKADDILGFLDEFKTATDTGFSNVLSAIDDLSTDVETAKTEILANLSSVYSDLSSKLDDVSSAISSARTSIEDKITSAKDELSTKADTLAGDLKKTVEEKTDAVNSNVTTFSLTLLILIVVLIGLVGYSVIAARRVR